MSVFQIARTIFVSDVHIFANRQKNMKLFSSFLDRIIEENAYRAAMEIRRIELFLLGDIFDVWFVFDKKQNPIGLDSIGGIERQVVNKIRKISKTTKVTLIVGNHDELFRQPEALKRINENILPDVLTLASDTEYTTAKNKKIYLTHGDKYDPFMYLPRALLRGAGKFKFLQPFQKIVYKFWGPRILLKIKVHLNKKYGAAMCGHTHNPMIEHNYINTGDWVDHHTFVVENEHGDLSLEVYDTDPKYRKVCNNRGEIVVPITK